MNPSVDLAGVEKRYGAVVALEHLSLQARPGEMLGLLGHNGAGKTTTIKLILGLTAPTAGRLRVLGDEPRGPAGRALRAKLGYLPESVQFYEQLSGREVLEYLARLKRLDIAACPGLLERVGLADAARRRVKTYSKGMRQRLGLAQALLGQPRLLLLDEPTVGLDPLGTRDLFAMLDELRQGGTTVIVSSHVLPGIERHVDRIAILRQGRLRAFGTLDELRGEAGLPLTIRVRGRWPAGFWEPRLGAQGLVASRINGTQLELTSPSERKLEVMRLLLGEPAVQDLEVAAPSLESLYVHYNAAEKAEVGHV